jgi:hypothetical protein
MGWDDKTREFYCGKYSITQNGEVKLLKQYPTIRDEHAYSWPEPDSLPPGSLSQFLAPDVENAAVWALLAALAAQMLAPVFGRQVQSIGVVDSMYAEASAILTSVGIPSKIPTTYGNASSSQVYNMLDAISDWPTLIGVPGNARIFRRGVLHFPNKPAFLRINDASIPGALSYGWGVISCPVPLPVRDYSALPHVIAAYVRYTLQNHTPLFRADVIRTVLQDMHTWLAQTYGTTFNLECAEKLIYLPGQEHIALMHAVAAGILSQHIDLLPAPRKRGQHPNYIVRNKEGWWLNQTALHHYFGRIGGLVPNWIGIVNILGEQTVMRLPGFVVNRDWCDAIWKECREQNNETNRRSVG